ncbi:MAG: hypothetical protein R6V49_03960 [Bacteroidales bacterium]
MKKNYLTSSWQVISIALIVIFGSSCMEQKVLFLTSAVVPAAEGRVVIKPDKNHNYVINITISNLAAVERLQPSKNAYVVWMEMKKGSYRNLGQIVSSESLNASFETVSTVMPVKIFITAEDYESVTYPGTTVVLTTRRF